MIKVLIIEDENSGRNKLNRFLNQLEENVLVIAELESLEEIYHFFQNPEEIDVIISDIELRDGNVFSFLEKANINCPIIFTTAYNQFWTNAFEGMGIEYLLKPFNFKRFQKAWTKYLSLSQNQPDSRYILKKLETLFIEQQEKTNEYKTRFSYKKGISTAFIETNEIALITAEEGALFIITENGNRLLAIENSLHKFVSELDKKIFFQINRSDIVNKRYVQEIQRYSRNVIAIKIMGVKEWLRTSQSKTSEFNKWMNQ